MGFVTGHQQEVFDSKWTQPTQPICYDAEGSFGHQDLKTLFVFVTAGRMIYNFSGIEPMIPLGIASLVSYLKKHKYHNIAVVDQPGWRLTDREMETLLRQHPFDVYGLSTNLFSISRAIHLSRFIKKEINPDALIVLGGPSGAYAPESILSECDAIDVVHTGEGEAAMLEIIQSAKRGEKPKNIKGLYWRSNTEVQYGGMVRGLDLAEVPLPARHLFPNHRYNMHPPLGAYGKVISIETLRGCNYGCNFCSIQRTVRFRPIEHVLEELSSIVAQGYREVHFIDPTFSIQPERAKVLCEAIAKHFPKLRWTCKNRIDTVTPELLTLMARAGCYMIAYGVESGDDQILSRLNKNLTEAKIRSTLRATHDAGIRALTYILIGAPGETQRTVQNTVRLLKEEKVDFSLFGELMPDTDAALFKSLIKKGVIPKSAIRDFILFENQEELFSHTPSGETRDVLNQWLSEANRSFYIRPRYIWQRLRDLRTIRDGFNMVKGLALLLMEAGRSRAYANHAKDL